MQKKIEKDGFLVEILTGKTPMAERDNIRARFAQGDINILLSSEVGSEGLDQQHCHRLVNYDLPWNPMKLEQRIGRLDRYGQKSPIIQIANLCVEGTIDASILGRLLHRIHIFESSLGMVDPMLGKAMKVLAEQEISKNIDDQEVKISWNSRRGRIYGIYSTTNLVDGDWEELDDSVEGEGEITSFTDPGVSVDDKKRFYRVVELE